MSNVPQIIQLKIRLLGVSPMIWRRAILPSSVTLRDLHGIIQVAMGWEGTPQFGLNIVSFSY